ncbi:MAG: hypothetical protein COZ70_04560 [Deltaproteobacteria bacterium CG_4_8_14_3_um_filter_51_11]|nr:hypothetical protein [bacterium]OIP40259.1 MAG: hypothetical protein AUK25_08150 [Desulfobacteraceae bacterium CG2_30_51_40]PIP45521.1 MAG: hypothetical protein COX16_12885 [Deltaproteobacteria bacterium CG23_combo_of_CG06-09_8_20_14_all_51_20]PIX20280.1 MAG: hypothetical protein COZ70_04560 [Deltaproteobacteria bacterium CG_4_8_14_3_um_filter_51_11]PIY25557.1 MAG: hypothetical protein COZ11_04900 [Deltaproteobacteria bacterium CG_4_10_14_3_um_filter_51_14]PJB39069.1 MAG: hypothetical prote
MQRKRAFEPYDVVIASGGQVGIIVDFSELEGVKARFREGRRPGSHFAPGCCHVLDYTTQVPVLFEDGTYNVMRGLGIRKFKDADQVKRQALERMLTGA